MKFSEISSLYSNKKYTEIVEIVENNQEIKNNEYCKMILGFSYLQLQQPQKAINCLRNIKTSEQRKYFGEIYEHRKNYFKSIIIRDHDGAIFYCARFDIYMEKMVVEIIFRGNILLFWNSIYFCFISCCFAPLVIPQI